MNGLSRRDKHHVRHTSGPSPLSTALQAPAAPEDQLRFRCSGTACTTVSSIAPTPSETPRLNHTSIQLIPTTHDGTVSVTNGRKVTIVRMAITARVMLPSLRPSVTPHSNASLQRVLEDCKPWAKAEWHPPIVNSFVQLVRLSHTDSSVVMPWGSE